MIKVFEAFSGIGTQRMALRNLGIEHEVVAIAEIDKFAIKSYEAIHGETNNLGDISKINTEDIPDHDLFTYSFPCQDISVAGKGLGLDVGSGTRSGLLWECQKVIAVKKPKYLLLENVKHLVGNKHKHNFDKWLEWLSEQGYTNYWQVLNAKDYGIPQNRERVFVVSILGDHEPYEFPEPIELELRLKDVLESEVSSDFNVPTEMVINWQNKRGGFGKRFSFSKLNEAAYTLVAKSGRAVITNNYIPIDLTLYNEVCGLKSKEALNYIITRGIIIRSLTPLEYWRLMGCTDEDFHKAEQVNSNSQLYKQAGNAIVVDVLEAIFGNLFKK